MADLVPKLDALSANIAFHRYSFDSAVALL